MPPPTAKPADRLRAFYDKEKIAAKGFACPHQKFCERAEKNGALTHAPEAFVGSRYGELTKVAIVSLDTGHEPHDLAERREAMEKMDEAAAWPHMQATIHLLRKLLPRDLHGGPPLPYAALLHAAKCFPRP